LHVHCWRDFPSVSADREGGSGTLEGGTHLVEHPVGVGGNQHMHEY